MSGQWTQLMPVKGASGCDPMGEYTENVGISQ